MTRLLPPFWPLALTMFAMVTTAMPMSPAWAQSSAPQASPAVPAANINITPRRVVFDAGKRTEAVYVFNQGAEPVTVDVALVDNVMLSSGEIAPMGEIARKGNLAQATATRMRSARDLILATPSRLRLEPGKGKAVRIRASLPDQAGDGEWRSHLTVSTVPSAETGVTAETAAQPPQNELAFRIQSVFGISIPLILRSGVVAAAANIGSISLERGETPDPNGGVRRSVPLLSFTLNRSGTNSIYGNLEARAENGGSREVIGFIRGIAVYPELDERKVALQLTREPRRGETIVVTFYADDPQLRGLQATGRYTAP